MRFKQLNIEVNHTFWIELFDNENLDFQRGDLGQLRLSSYTGKLQLIIKNKLFTISLPDSHLFNEIALEFERGNANLVEISRVYRNKDWPTERVQLELELVLFNGPEIDLDTIDIYIDNRTLEQAKESGVGDKFDKINGNLKKYCSLTFNNESYVIAILGASALDQLNQIDRLENDVDVQQNIKNGLVLLGDNLQLAIQQYSGGENSYLGVRRLVTRKHTVITRALRLVKLQLNFSEHQQMMSSLASYWMNKITKEQEGYLSTWDRYAQLEGEQLLKRARKIGRIEVDPDRCESKIGNQMFIYVDKDWRGLLTQQDSLLMVPPESPIVHLDNLEMDWATFSAQILKDYKAKKGFDNSLSSWKQQLENEESSRTIRVDSETTPFLKIIKVEEKRIIVEGADKPLEKMVIVLSILGDQVQVERRMAARNAIIQGKSAMPHLGLLIEDGAEIPSGRVQRPTIKPLSDFVKKKVFPRNPPTLVQKKAIEIALNTPDIAIIQGPPGTGKTTVITAIIERLNQERDKSKSIQGDILVSGYQHNAVENLLNRLSVNDLPAIKFGKRSGEEEQCNSTDIKLDEWRLNIVERIYQHTPELKEGIAYLQLERDSIAYAQRPSDSVALRLVNKARELLIGIPNSEGTIKLLEALSKELSTTSDDYEMRILRSLRLSKESFMDDGVNRVVDLMDWFKEHNVFVEDEDLNVLKQAMAWHSEKDLNFLPQLKEIKLKLLKQFMPRPQLKRDLARKDVQSVIRKALDLLQDSSRHKLKNKALIEYLSDLEGNPYLVQDALAEYNLVYGATTGQSEGTDIRRLKSKSGDGKGYMQYSTVIIDEAARASPLDLMIPMVQAKDRIILVGDHRQLPHIIDESLLEQMARESDNTNQDIKEQFNQHITRSMFQYLFERCKKLEQQDGKPRTITLDAQYRSHPLLGQFASEQFYDPYGEGYKSPLPASNFSQQLEGIEDQAAVWIDVPAKNGREERDTSKSRFRKAEAEAIAKYLNKWINSEPGKSLSFGVISFYKAQVKEIMKALARYKITEQDEQGNYFIARNYQMLFDNEGKPIEERIRVGTVDSFQGMEFDVVFLSMVRSQPEIDNLSEECNFSVKKQQQIFGHLMSKNRLCVSVTRQKRALILVGDAQLIQTPIAKQAIPELQAFYGLCHSQGVIL